MKSFILIISISLILVLGNSSGNQNATTVTNYSQTSEIIVNDVTTTFSNQDLDPHMVKDDTKSMSKLTTQPISLSNLVVSVDLSHVPVDFVLNDYHDQVNHLKGNLTSFGGTFNEITGVFSIPVGTNVLLIPNSDVFLTAGELNAIYNWYNEVGPRLLWVSGDSDVNDEFASDANNGILDRIGSKLRLSTDTVEDYTNNDGAFYRVVAQTPVSDGNINSMLTNNVSSIIMHGPTSVLGYDNSAVVDLSTTSLPGVEVIMKSSSTATIVNNQTTPGEFDYYTANSIAGNYPMVAIESMGDQKYTLVSGETIFSDYKRMYDLFTETGTWNGGRHDGKNLVDNVFSWFRSHHYFPHAPINVENDGQFLSQGFVGTGTETDPYVIEGINITTSASELVHIGSVSAHFEIRDSVFNGLNMDNFALFFFEIQNGLIINNMITNVLQSGIFLENSNSSTVEKNSFINTAGVSLGGSTGAHQNSILDNTIMTNNVGIYLDHSENNAVFNNTITDSSQQGIYLGDSSYTTITGNEIFDNQYNGVEIDGSSNTNNLSNNVIYNNDGTGIFVGGSDNAISMNDFSNNFPGGIPGTTQAGDTGTNNEFTQNYWSDWTGSGAYNIWESANNQDDSPQLNPNHMSVSELDIEPTTSNDGITSGTMTISWSANNYFNHGMKYSLYYSNNEGSSWQLVADDLTSLTYVLDTIEIPDGSNILLKVRATDEVGFIAEQISNMEYLIANAPHELSKSSFLTPNSGDTLTGTVTISWTAAIESWGHGVAYSLKYFKGTASVSSTWIDIVNGLTDTSWDWDTTALENGQYSLRIEASSDSEVASGGLVNGVTLDGVVTVENQVESSTSDEEDSGSSFISFNIMNIGILSLLMSAVLVRKRKVNSR
ncbi:MAG: right-handed parallel beta-helix repeat-containing protein [Candidatus Kariarchaeaceae archaeon]